MAKDPYKYFRVEARELVDALTRGVLDLEKGAVGDDGRPRLLRFAHTLKGAARVVRQPEIAELTHRVEDALSAGHDGPAGARASAAACLELLDAIAARVSALGKETEAEAGEREGTPRARTTEDERTETLRVDRGDLDELQTAAAEIAVHVAAIREGARATLDVRRAAEALVALSAGRPGGRSEHGGALARGLDVALDRLEGGLGRAVERAEAEIAGIRDTVARLRLVPASTIFASLERAARDAAHATGTAISFEAVGGEMRLDAHVLAALHSALVHVVRNAVAHGRETGTERRALGKPPALLVRLVVERRGDGVAFACSDDGRGIDVDAVRRAAVQHGTAGADVAAAMTEREVVRLVLAGGLTTTGSVTEVAGRGVGLDVVRETAATLKGEVDIRTEQRRGTTVEICVPVSLSSLAVLLVSTCGLSAALPLDAVRGTLRVRAEDRARTASGETILHDGQPIPFCPLDRLLGERARHRGAAAARPPTGSPASPVSTVVVEAKEGVCALGVDRSIGVASVMMRPLPAMLAVERVVMGTALDAQGDPELVLDPGELVRAVRTAAAPGREAPLARRRPVLIVDDSLTTRMLEQSILESAGYEVGLCSSAEEALAAAEARPGFYGLFVVDVEMPGMDGFEFIARTRADPALRETPAILVTSRGSIEDQRRGERVGARGYIVKGDFDQAHLLGIVRELAG